MERGRFGQAVVVRDDAVELILVLVSKRRVINSVVLTIGIIGLSFVGVMIGVGGPQAVGDTSSGTSRAPGGMAKGLRAVLGA